MKPVRTLAVAAALLVASACSDDSTAPLPGDDGLTDDVAQMSAQAAVADLETMQASGAVAGMRDGNGPVGDDRGDRRFPADATFFDGAGQAMDGYDPLLTAAVSWSFTREAELDRGHVTGSISRSRSMTISGLLGEEIQRTHDGEGSDARSRVVVSDTDGTRTYDVSSQVQIAAVVHAVDRVAQPWPLSGTITRQVQVQVVNGRNGDVDESHTSVLTFNGTQYATLSVDGETFEVDLAERGGRMAERGGTRGHRGGGGPNG